MRTFIAPAIASSLCLCTFHAPVAAQTLGNPDAIDVHVHAMKPEDFEGLPVTANFGAFRKTYRTNERDPETLMRRTLAEMDKNRVSKAVISGDDEVVVKWVQRYPNRFLASYNHWCDGNSATVAKFESEWKAGKRRAIGELGLPGHSEDDPSLCETCRTRTPVSDSALLRSYRDLRDFWAAR